MTELHCVTDREQHTDKHGHNVRRDDLCHRRFLSTELNQRAKSTPQHMLFSSLERDAGQRFSGISGVSCLGCRAIEF